MQFFVTKKEKIKQKCAIIQPKCWKFHSHSNRLGSRDSKITHGKIWILKPISNGWFWTKMTTFDLVFIRPRILHTETTSPEIVRFLLPLTLDKVIILIEFYKVLVEEKKKRKKKLRMLKFDISQKTILSTIIVLSKFELILIPFTWIFHWVNTVS